MKEAWSGMIDTIRLYFRYAALSVRGQMQYRASFLMMTSGEAILTTIEFLGIALLFQRFGHLRGWTLPQVAFFYGAVNVAYAIAEVVARGFDVFPRMVKSGDVDRLLLRPRGVAFQVAAQELHLVRLGRLLQGAVVLGWSVSRPGSAWSPARAALTLAIIGGTACVFYGLFVIYATMSFWTIEALEIMNAFTYGGTETASYPMSIYQPWFRRFFTFIVPLACTGYFPGRVVLGLEHGPAAIMGASLAPLVGVLFLVIALQLWKVGVSHYRSTGS